MSEKIYIPNDEDQIKEMFTLYEGGMSYSEIGDRYGINFQKVWYIFSKKGFKARKFTVSKRFRAGMDGKRKLLDRELLTRLYVEDRLSTKKIASILNINFHVVYSNLIFYEIPLRPTENYTTSELTPEILKRLYIDENLTAQQIGDQLGFSVLTIRKRLHKFGIKKRNNQDAEAKNEEPKWFTLPELYRTYQIPLPVLRRLVKRGVFANARRETSSGSSYWIVPAGDVENYRLQLETLAQKNSSDPQTIIQFRYGYSADEILEIIEFDRQNFSRDEIAAIFRIDRVLIDDLIEFIAAGNSPQKIPDFKRLPKKILLDLHIKQKRDVEEILKRLNTTYLSFYLSLRHWGIPLNHSPEKAVPPPPLTDRRKQMIRLYESGLSLSEVGEEFGLDASTVSYNFKRAGYQARPFTNSARFKAGFKKKTRFLEKETLEKLYTSEGLSIKKIADKLGETMWRVRQNLIFYNISIRSG